MKDHLDNPGRPTRLTLCMKRTFDIVLSGLAIIVLLPVFAIVAAAIKFDSPGPAFFRQQRVGRGGHLFRIFKFRSMVDGTSRTGSALTVRADPRITRWGAFLRDKKIDELPQLFNVFAGSMSFVGPRPEVPEFMEFYTSEQRAVIHSMRPGITDYAAILFRGENDILDGEEDPVDVYRRRIMPIKFALYERYSREIGLVNDLRLIFRTLSLLISTKNSDWLQIEKDAVISVSAGTVVEQASASEPFEQAR